MIYYNISDESGFIKKGVRKNSQTISDLLKLNET